MLAIPDALVVLDQTGRLQQPEDISRLTSDVYFNYTSSEGKPSESSMDQTDALIKAEQKIRAQMQAQFTIREEELKKAEAKLAQAESREQELLQALRDAQRREREAEQEKARARKVIEDSSFIPGIM